MEQQDSNTVFDKKKNYFFTGVLLVICYFFYNNVLLSQLSRPLAPPLVFPSIDNAYWALLGSGVYKFVVEHGLLTVLFDIALLAMPLLIVFLPTRQWLFILFLLLAVFYFLAQNIIAGHHFHSFVGVVFLSLPFCFGAKRFEHLWRAMRYYTLFVFVSAALWKIARGNIFETYQMVYILKAQHAQFLYEQPTSIHAMLLRWLMAHSGFCTVLLFSAVAIQLFFLVGFFTRKADLVLLGLMVLFVIVNYAVMRIVSFELLVLGLTLLPSEFWEANLNTATPYE
ncbi:MAG: hypothetical protein U0T72_03205 [Chitinophagales bacterium]